MRGSQGRDSAVGGVGLAGFGPEETKRSWRRGVFVAGRREGRLRLFGEQQECLFASVSRRKDFITNNDATFSVISSNNAGRTEACARERLRTFLRAP